MSHITRIVPYMWTALGTAPKQELTISSHIKNPLEDASDFSKLNLIIITCFVMIRLDPQRTWTLYQRRLININFG